MPTKVIIKILTLLGLFAGLLGAVKLFNAVKPNLVKAKSEDVSGEDSRALLDENLSKHGIKLVFWGFLAQFSAVFCQLFYY
ncbi:MAG: hypothetical protein PHE97_07055 [Candidatus Omnitrophica bacterium]|nr:hypothetical protein [Candidatus Omnitrophota bacterium]